MGSQNAKKLTELELEIMIEIWKLGESTISDVNAALKLNNKKDYAYTTVATMMKILEKKKFLSSKKSERAHKYTPLVSKDTYENTAADHFVDKVLGGSPARLVMRLLDEGKLDKDELTSIRETLDMWLKND